MPQDDALLVASQSFPIMIVKGICLLHASSGPAQSCAMYVDVFIAHAANDKSHCVQEMSQPVRQYKMMSLRQMFRPRGSTPGNLQKAFFRTSDMDADLA